MLIVDPCSLVDQLFPLMTRAAPSPQCSGCLPEEAMHPLQIEGTSDQGPLAFDLLQSPEQKLPDAQHFLDDAEDWLGRSLPPPVEVFALSGL